MQISKKAWHYKVIHGMNWPVPNNLCKYVWTLFIALLAWPMLLAMVVVFVPFLFVMNAIGAACRWLLDRLPSREKKERVEIIEEREPSLIGAWVRAKKQRVCPIIKFTD